MGIKWIVIKNCKFQQEDSFSFTVDEGKQIESWKYKLKQKLFVMGIKWIATQKKLSFNKKKVLL